MEYLIGGTALLLLILGPVAFVGNRKAAQTRSAPLAAWTRLYRRRWPLLLLLGTAAIFFSYSTMGHDGLRYRVYGFPFPAAAFDSRGADYVGLVTLPFALFNVIIWTTIPDICLFVWRLALLRRNATLGA